MDWQPSGIEQTRQLDSAGTSTLPIASGVKISTSIFDVRQASSYYMSAFATVDAAPAAFHPFRARVNWFLDPFGLEPSYMDQWLWWSHWASGSIWDVEELGFFSQDNLHGPYMQLELFNASAVAQHIDYNFTASTRVLSGPYQAQSGLVNTRTQPYALYATDTLAGLAGKQYHCYFGHGNALLRVTSGSNQLIVQPALAGDTVLLDSFFVAAFTVSKTYYNIPKQSLKVTVTNNAAGNTTFDANVIFEIGQQ